MTDKTEQILEAFKRDFDRLEVPPELEDRLVKALENKPFKKRTIKSRWKIQIAAGFLMLLFLGYNFDAMAYYSKKLMGYDHIMNGSLKQLNDLGKGQIIDKSCRFQDGTVVTLDGVMLDQNQMLVFVTAENSKGNIDQIHLDISRSIPGLFGEYDISSGRGITDENNTKMKWIYSFEPPFFLQKNLTIGFEIRDEEKREVKEITFSLDRSKAMSSALQKKIKQSIEVDQTMIRFDSILASPTQTVIKGSILNLLQLAEDQLRGERFRPSALDIKLYANGVEIPEQGGGMGTDLKGITFHKEYEPLPEKLQTLQLKLTQFEADHDLNQVVKLDKSKNSQTFRVMDQQMTIEKIYEKEGNTYVTFTTEDTVALTKVYLIADGKRLQLEETVTDHHDKKPEGVILHTRTMRFEGTGHALQLDIRRMKYAKAYNKVIDIPVE